MKGHVATPEASALIARTARHFWHKVPVTTSDGYASIETRFGRAELAVSGDGFSIALASPDRASLESLRGVVTSHVTRFARTPVDIHWFDDKQDPEAASND